MQEHRTEAEKKKAKKNSGVKGPLIELITLCVFMAVFTDGFVRVSNFLNILRQASVNSLMTFGMLFVLLTGGIDLSVGAIVACSGCTMGVMINAGINNTFVLLFCGLAVGFVIGLVNGLLITKLNLPHPFISTLGIKLVIRGICLMITGSAAVDGFTTAIMFLGYESICGFPICFILIIIIAIIAALFLNKTAWGRYIYSIGGNRDAARLSGINVKALLNLTYILSGVCSALAGIVLIGRVSLAYPTAGEGYEMNAIAACVIGGASFNGGKGTVSGALIGALMIAVLNNGLSLMGVGTDVQDIILGLVIIVAVFVDVVRTQADEKKRRFAQANA